MTNSTEKIFRVEFADEPGRNCSFIVRGICNIDVLNPCWDNRIDDVPGRHWGGGPACEPCLRAALEAAR